MTEEIIRIIIEALMSGALIITLVTLRSTKKKAAEQAKSIEIDNDKNIMQNFLEYIVENNVSPQCRSFFDIIVICKAKELIIKIHSFY